jgi:protein-L-isoaspartate(D-aspartate) O-methyltransferase
LPRIGLPYRQLQTFQGISIAPPQSSQTVRHIYLMNVESARQAMISQQIRSWDVTDENILNCFSRIQREDFVPEQYLNVAFADVEIPIGHEQHMLKPIIEGRLLQALDLQQDQRVLVIGTGTGYLTACVARLADHVTSIDIVAEFVQAAHERLRTARAQNVDLQHMDYNELQPGHGYDRILATGSLPLFDPRLVDWLRPDGQAIATIGTAPAMTVERISRDADHYTREKLFETVIAPLNNTLSKENFSF